MKQTGIVLNKQCVQDAKNSSRLVTKVGYVEVELFFSIFKFHEEAMRTRVKLPVENGKEAYFLSPEAICAAKVSVHTLVI